VVDVGGTTDWRKLNCRMTLFWAISSTDTSKMFFARVNQYAESISQMIKIPSGYLASAVA
jgi:hypothetical protein